MTAAVLRSSSIAADGEEPIVPRPRRRRRSSIVVNVVGVVVFLVAFFPVYWMVLTSFRRGVDVMVATPGRLLDHLNRPYGKLDGIEHLVLNEADRMLDMGFLPDIKRILGRIPRDRQTLFFSALVL